MYQSVYASLPHSWIDVLDQVSRLAVEPASPAYCNLAVAGLHQVIRAGLHTNLELMPGGWQGDAETVLADGVIFDLEARPLFRTSHQIVLPAAGIHGVLLALDKSPESWARLEMALVEMPQQSRLLALWFPHATQEDQKEILGQMEEYGPLMENGQIMILIGQTHLWISRGHGSSFQLIPGANGRDEALEGFVQGSLLACRMEGGKSTKPQKDKGQGNPRPVREGGFPLGLRHNKQGQVRPKYKAVSPDPADPDGNYPLHLAVLKKDAASVARLLNEGHDPNCKNKEGDTPLHVLIAKTSNTKIAAELVEAGADLNARNHICVAPLHVAVMQTNEKMLRWLLEQGAEIEARNNRAFTPLHKAAELGHLPIVNTLLKHQADIHARMEKDIQPLHLAAWYGHEKLIEFLLEQGADIDATNDDGNCSLHFAAFNGQVKVIKRLMQLSANPALTNAQGETYLQGINEGYQGAMIHVLG
ncbi:MAG: ankyrin repeat domain-containing protein [Bacteroidota bacterium]